MSQAKAKEEVQAEKNQYSLIGYKEVLMILALKQIQAFKNKEEAYRIQLNIASSQHIKKDRNFLNN